MEKEREKALGWGFLVFSFLFSYWTVLLCLAFTRELIIIIIINKTWYPAIVSLYKLYRTSSWVKKFWNYLYYYYFYESFWSNQWCQEWVIDSHKSSHGGEGMPVCFPTVTGMLFFPFFQFSLFRTSKILKTVTAKYTVIILQRFPFSF